jgi:hypothetical protein
MSSIVCQKILSEHVRPAEKHEVSTFPELNCRGEIDKICGFLCDKAAVFRDMIKWTHCT